LEGSTKEETFNIEPEFLHMGMLLYSETHTPFIDIKPRGISY